MKRSLLTLVTLGLLTLICLPLSAQVGPGTPQLHAVQVDLVGQGTVQVDQQPLYGGTTFSTPTTVYFEDPNSQGVDLQWTATADDGWVFDHWEYGPQGNLVTSSNNPLNMLLEPGVSSPTFWTVRAVFTQGYVLTINKQGEGTTNPAVGTHPYTQGEVVQICATPAAGWTFDHWDGDVANPGSAGTTVTMNSSKTVTAFFAQIGPVTLTINKQGEGMTNPAVGIYAQSQGETVSVCATAADGWVFDHWDGDVASATSACTSVTMNASKTITAVFVPLGSCTLAIQVVGQGTTNPVVGLHAYPCGQQVLVCAIPADGYLFDHWEGSVWNPYNVCTTITLSSDETVTAHFVEGTPTPPPSGAFTDDVEGGPGGWIAEPLWHITSTRSHSPSHSWWFGNEGTGTYASGGLHPTALSGRKDGTATPKAASGRVRGELTSPPISVGDWGDVAVMSLWHWRHVEYYPDGAYDRTYAQVSFFNEVWETVWSRDSRDASQQQWERIALTVNIPPRTTRMWVRFVFDSVDGQSNDYPGWFIDDLQVGPPDMSPVITVCPLATGKVGQPYGPVQLIATGGVPPYTWSWAPGVPGLALDQRTGIIAGTPTAEGSYDLTISVVDSGGERDYVTCRLVVEPDWPCACVLLPLESFDEPTGWTMTGLWHVDRGLQCIACASVMNEYAYFGRNGVCSYGTGQRVHGELRSPTIDIPECVERIVIEFDHFRHVEAYPDGYDRTWVEIRFDGAAWETLWSRDAGDVSPECAHVQLSRDVPGGAAHVWLRFRFDSIDRFYNEYPGWAIDNVEMLNADCVSLFNPQALSMSDERMPAPRSQISVTNVPNPITDVHTTIFTVRGVDVEVMKIQIFDLSGALVYEEEVAGNELEWHTDSNYGEYLANGVYLYRALVKVGGEWAETSIQKLVILR